MKRATFFLLPVFCILTACGGGGGGSGASSGNASKSVLQGDTRSSGTGIRLLNGAVDSAPIDLLSSAAAEPLTTTRFSLPAGFAAVSTAPQIISVVPTKSTSPRLFAQEFTLLKNEHVTILMYGDHESLGLSVTILPDRRVPDLGDGEAGLRLIHATNRALSLDGLLDGSQFASETAFGTASSYARVPAGSHLVTARRAADGFIVYSASVELDGGQNYSLFVTGEVGFLTVGRLLQD